MNSDRRTRERLREIEERKIEILLEIGRVNDQYGEIVSRLDIEYRRLDAEHYKLRCELIRERPKDDPI